MYMMAQLQSDLLHCCHCCYILLQGRNVWLGPVFSERGDPEAETTDPCGAEGSCS